MAEHYVRSAYIAPNPTNNRPMACVGAYVFHWLRCLGWEWAWEGDGEEAYENSDPFPYARVNHIPDGNMETAGVTNWTVTGSGSVSKSTSVVKSGAQSLRFDAVAADVLQSDAWTNMVPAGSDGAYNPYDCVIWVYNDSGYTFTADLIGSVVTTTGPVSLTSTGGWAMYHIGCTINDGTLLPFVSVRLEVEAPAGNDGTIYIGWALGFTSQYEWNDATLFDSGTDGNIQNGDEFASASHTFVGGDVGRFICCYDPSNPENSGIYKVSSISGSNAVLDLRVGNNEVLTNTSASEIVWRLVYYAGDWGDTYKTGGSGYERAHSGYILESPHASKQRFMFRNTTDGTARRGYLAGSPEDCDFDPDTGQFYKSGRSSIRNRIVQYEDWVGGSNSPGTLTHGDGVKLWMMAEDDGSYFFVCLEDEDSGSVDSIGFGMALTGEDANHPYPDDWALFHQLYVDTGNQWDRLGVVVSGKSTVSSFTMISPNSLAMEACMPTFGVGTTADIEEDANVDAEPFGGTEQLYPPIIWRDPDGSYNEPSEKVVSSSDVPIWWGRPNMTNWTPFAPTEGTNSAFSISGSTVTLTAGESVFTAAHVGKAITVAGATSGGNDGTFVITSYIGPTQVTYENASGVTEAGAGTFEVGPEYIHISQGMVFKWNGFTVP